MKITVRQLKKIIRESVEESYLKECNDEPCTKCDVTRKHPQGEDIFAYIISKAGNNLFVDPPS